MVFRSSLIMLCRIVNSVKATIFYNMNMWGEYSSFRLTNFVLKSCKIKFIDQKQIIQHKYNTEHAIFLSVHNVRKHILYKSSHI